MPRPTVEVLTQDYPSRSGGIQVAASSSLDRSDPGSGLRRAVDQDHTITADKMPSNIAR